MKSSPSTSASERPEGGAPARPWGLAIGLPGLLFWLVTGLGLESLHAFKEPAYLLDPVRRLMWTLAHAHGTLLSAIALLLALVVLPRVGASPRLRRHADRLFASGAVLLPLGFLIGGAWHPEGDPGPGIFLVPAGALACIAGLALACVATFRGRGPSTGTDA